MTRMGKRAPSVLAAILITLAKGSSDAWAEEAAARSSAGAQEPPKPEMGIELGLSLQTVWLSALPDAPLQSNFPFRTPTPRAPKSGPALAFGGGAEVALTFGKLVLPTNVDLLFMQPPTVDLGGGASLHSTATAFVFSTGIGVRSAPGTWT